MQNTPSLQERHQLKWFCIFFVLFEFSTYAANDMIMPGMLQVVHSFHAPITDVANSLTFFMLGTCLLQLVMGPIASSYSNRPVLLCGNVLFLVFTLFLALSFNLESFMIGRLLQGSCIAFVVLGYSIIHAYCDDRQSVKMIAMMANVTLLAPILGPVIGSAMIHLGLELGMGIHSWRVIFIISAVTGLISLRGLLIYTPADKHDPVQMGIRSWLQGYLEIMKLSTFWFGALSLGFICMPFILWIALSPTLIMVSAHLSLNHYLVAQLLVISGLMCSTIILHRSAGKYAFHQYLKLGISLSLLGTFIGFLQHNNHMLMIVSLFLCFSGMGFVCVTVNRVIGTLGVSLTNLVFPLLGLIQSLELITTLVLGNRWLSKQNYHIATYFHLNFYLILVSAIWVLMLAKKIRYRRAH